MYNYVYNIIYSHVCIYIDLRINFEPSQFMSHLMVQGFS